MVGTEQAPVRRIDALKATMSGLYTYAERSRYFERSSEPDLLDFAFGNPHDMAPANYVRALQRATEPQDSMWFAYKTSEPYAREVVAASLSARLDMPFEPDDIAMTLGGYGAICAALTALLSPGDEVIINRPPWFLYGATVASASGTLVTVSTEPETFNLDLNAIAAAITPRTRVVIVNTPNNPTGRIYPPETLHGLAELLTAASDRYGRTIYLLSDEAYNRIVFEGNVFHSPIEFYSHTLLAYSYGKTLMAPGQRIGYLALSPLMPLAEREQLRQDVDIAQVLIAWNFPNAILQRALPELEQMSFDVGRLQRKRDRMVGALREIGYSVHVPEGTFYLFPKTPIADDWAFIELLQKRNVFCHPGSISDVPGYFRICLTATEETIEAALPHFAAAFEEALART